MDRPAFTLADLDRRVGFTPLLNRGIRGDGITVAVLDTGIRHAPDLGDAVVLDKDFTGEDNPKDVKNEHGTSIAQNIHMIAPGARIANLKVMPQDREPDRETVCKAIRFCVDEYPRYRIINLSVYFDPEGCSKTKRCVLCSMVNEAVSKGIVVVAAAGNLGPRLGTVTCPGSAEKAITVGSTWTGEEARWWESSNRIKRWWGEVSGEFGKAFGTSYSTAYVSGGVALLLSAFREAAPDEIKRAILESSSKLPKAPEAAGMMRCEEALNVLLQLKEYADAKRVLYLAMGNEPVQASSLYFKRALEVVLKFIDRVLIGRGRYTKAIEELEEVRGYLIPGASPSHEQKIKDLLKRSSHNLVAQGLVTQPACR